MKSSQEILDLQKTLLKLENLHASFDYLQITIASPNRIKTWSERILPDGEIVGEILKPETINFRTHQPELYGLFCERIFGPIKNWKCRCGKYNGFAVDKVCEECKVEVIEARVRRYRMGYIDLICPVAHLWYLKGVPSYLSILLKCIDEKISVAKIEQIIYFKEGSRIISPDNPLYEFFIGESLIKNESKNLEYEKNFSFDSFYSSPKVKKNENEKKDLFKNSKFYKISKRKGAEIIKAALDCLDLISEIKKARLQVDVTTLSDLKKTNIVDKGLIRRIRILESFISTKTNPSWMILTVLPVLPPNLRPLVELENGRLVAADVNEIYRLIITRNLRLRDFLYRYIAPDLISIQGRKLLQEGVDSLIDNARLPKNKIFCLNNKPLKSLTEILEGKQGRFRQSLLGKRVDYSGRSVIIVGPALRLNECGLPYEMACKLFQPFLINELLKTKIKPPSHNTKLARIIISKNKPFIWSLLEQLTRKHCILLNRAPTLHRFGIQAFNPIIVLGQAIHLHPLVCTGFNADFDGDQMAVHLPLYETSQLEARTMMRPSYNVLSPSNGEVILKPTQDMVIGCYYLTLMITNNNSNFKGYKKWFKDETEALLNFYQKKITIHTPILVRYCGSDFTIEINNKSAKFIDNYRIIEKQDIKLYKIYKNGSKINKYYLLTSIGILIVNQEKENKYKIKELFLETTPGRLIFSNNLKNIIKT